MKGKTTSVYYKDLTQSEKDLVDNIERASLRKQRKDFIKDERYVGTDPESIWYLRQEYIDNWKFYDDFLFTKCECGSLEFETKSDTQCDLSRKCLMKCKKCGRTHIEYN